MRKKWPVILKVLMFLLAVAGIVWAGMAWGPALTRLAADPERMDRFLASFGAMGILIFIGLQIVQVIIAVIPGELVEIAGGYMYGIIGGTILSIIGIAAGSAINFALGRLFGQSLLQLFISEQRLDHMSRLLNGQKSKSMLLILFLLPGVPKDILCYIGGLLPIRPLTFLTVSTLARVPALIITCYIGANLRAENYLLAAIVTGVACLILLLAFPLRKRITAMVRHRTIARKRRKRRFSAREAGRDE